MEFMLITCSFSLLWIYLHKHFSLDSEYAADITSPVCPKLQGTGCFWEAQKKDVHSDSDGVSS